MYIVAKFDTTGDVASFRVTSPIYKSGSYLIKYMPISMYGAGRHPQPMWAEINAARTGVTKPAGVLNGEHPFIVLRDHRWVQSRDKNFFKQTKLRTLSRAEKTYSQLDLSRALTRRDAEAEKSGELVGISAGRQDFLFVKEISWYKRVGGDAEALSIRSYKKYGGEPLVLPAGRGFNLLDREGAREDARPAESRSGELSVLYTLRGIHYSSKEGVRDGAQPGVRSSIDGVARLNVIISTRSGAVGKVNRVFASKKLSGGDVKVTTYISARRMPLSGGLNRETGGKRRISEVTYSGKRIDASKRVVDSSVLNITHRTWRRMREGLAEQSVFRAALEGRAAREKVAMKGFKVRDKRASHAPQTKHAFLIKLDANIVRPKTLGVPGRLYAQKVHEISAERVAMSGNNTCSLTKWLLKKVPEGRESPLPVRSLREERKIEKLDVQPYENAYAPTDVVKKQETGQTMAREAEQLCLPRGLNWDELWEELYKEYDLRVDRLQLPTVDFAYDTSKLYDKDTGEPVAPLSNSDLPEVKVAFPSSHPIGKYADVGLKIVNVHLWVLRDIILLLYRDRKQNGLRYEKLPPGEAIRLAIDRLYTNLRQFDYRREEYDRAFRMARWYGEYVIVSTNDFWLLREYEPWVSHESSVSPTGGIPTEDAEYITRFDGWTVDSVNSVYKTVSRNAVLEISIENLLSSTFEFTVEVVNNSGTAKVNFMIDGKDKNYLISQFARVEADLPKGKHTILFEFSSESDEDRLELSGMQVDYVKFKSAQVLESPRDVNGAQALDMLIDMLLRYYELHHEGKMKGTRLIYLGKKLKLGR